MSKLVPRLRSGQKVQKERDTKTHKLITLLALRPLMRGQRAAPSPSVGPGSLLLPLKVGTILLVVVVVMLVMVVVLLVTVVVMVTVVMVAVLLVMVAVLLVKAILTKVDKLWKEEASRLRKRACVRELGE